MFRTFLWRKRFLLPGLAAVTLLLAGRPFVVWILERNLRSGLPAGIEPEGLHWSLLDPSLNIERVTVRSDFCEEPIAVVSDLNAAPMNNKMIRLEFKTAIVDLSKCRGFPEDLRAVVVGNNDGGRGIQLTSGLVRIKGIKVPGVREIVLTARDIRIGYSGDNLPDRVVFSLQSAGLWKAETNCTGKVRENIFECSVSGKHPDISQLPAPSGLPGRILAGKLEFQWQFSHNPASISSRITVSVYRILVESLLPVQRVLNKMATGNGRIVVSERITSAGPFLNHLSRVGTALESALDRKVSKALGELLWQ